MAYGLLFCFGDFRIGVIGFCSCFKMRYAKYKNGYSPNFFHFFTANLSFLSKADEKNFLMMVKLKFIFFLYMLLQKII